MQNSKAPKASHDSRKRIFFSPAAPVLFSALLLIVARLFEPVLFEGNSFYISVVVLQIMIFLLPSGIFIRMRGDGYLSKIRLKPARPESLILSLSASGLLVSGGLLLSMLFSDLDHLAGTFTLYETFYTDTGSFTGPTLYLILAYAVLPAVTEELLFRGILSAEYERHGVSVAVLASTMLFALIHFNFLGLPVYLFAGFVLSLTTFLCRSISGAILAHFLYNLFGLFGQPYIASFYEITGSTALFLFVLIGLFLLSLALFCGEAARLCRLYFARNIPNVEVPRYKNGASVPFLIRMRAALLKPDVLLLFGVWIVASILFLFL